MSPAVLKALSRQQRHNGSSVVVTSSFETALKILADFLEETGNEVFTHWRRHLTPAGQTVYHLLCEEEIGATAFNKPFSAKEAAVWIGLKKAKSKVQYGPPPKSRGGKSQHKKGWRISSTKKTTRRNPRVILTATWCRNKEKV